MLWTLVVFSIFFVWLLIETDFLRVRLPMGKAKSNSYIESLSQAIDKHWIEVEKYLTIKPVIPQLAQFCTLTRVQNELKGGRCEIPRGCNNQHYLESYQQMTFGQSVVKIAATLPNLYDLIEEAGKIQSAKHKPRQIQYRLSELGRYYIDKEARFLSNVEPICGKEWLEAHAKDEYPEPTIELEVNDKTFCVNGNYRKGIIAEFCGKVKKSRQSKMIEV